MLGGEAQLQLTCYRSSRASHDKILAAFAGVAKLKVHLVRPDGSRAELEKGLLCTAYSAWMREKDEDGVPKVSVLNRRMISNTNVSEAEYEKKALTLVGTLDQRPGCWQSG